MARLVPHPLLTILIAGVWILLANDFAPATFASAAIIGIVIPRVTSPYWTDRPRIRSPRRVVEYALVVLWDIVVANIQVAYLVLFRRGAALRSRFITVPLDLKSPEAIAALAGTITMTPGTLTADLSADGRALLVHCLEAADPAAAVAQIKHRYEKRLQRIFE